MAINSLTIPTRSIGTPDPAADMNAVVLKINELITAYNTVPSLPIPAKPLNWVVDDTANTYSGDLVTGYTLSEHEFSTDRGVTWYTLTSQTITIGNVAKLQDDVLVRVKAVAGVNNAGIPAGNLAAFTVSGTATPSPTISSLTPNNAGEGATVVITGTYFLNVVSVKFGGIDATAYTVDSATQITATVPTGVTVGASTVSVATPSGTVSTAFTINAPGNNNPELFINPEFDSPLGTGWTAVAGYANVDITGGKLITTNGTYDESIVLQTVDWEAGAEYELKIIWDSPAASSEVQPVARDGQTFTFTDGLAGVQGQLVVPGVPDPTVGPKNYRRFTVTQAGSAGMWLWIRNNESDKTANPVKLLSASLKKISA